MRVQILPTVAITHHGGQSTGQAPEAMFLALHRARRRFFAQLSPGVVELVRPLADASRPRGRIRAGYSLPTGVARCRGPTCRAQARMYGRAWRLWGGER